MSFGTVASDVDTVVAFCKALYRKCRDAGGDYDEISHEVRGLHAVLKHLKYEVEASDSPINKNRSAWTQQLSPIIGDCDTTLHELDTLVQEHESDRNTSKRTHGESGRRGSALDTVGLIRVRILGHKSQLTKFLDNIQLHQGGSTQEELSNEDGLLDVILDKVDIIAARIQSRNKRPANAGDDKEVWKQFRKELASEGVSGEVLEHHKDVLRAYIREIDQQGLLDEVGCDLKPAAAPVAGSGRWLDNVKMPQNNRPPSFSSLELPTEDTGTKERTTREENLKFPQSMKTDASKTEPGPSSSRQRRRSDHGNQTRQIPRLITSNETNEKALDYYNDDNGSSDDDLKYLSRQRSNSLQLGEVIKTTELIAYSQALQLHPHSPSSFRSTQSYFEDKYTHKPLPCQPKKQIEFSTSPLQSGALPIPIPQPLNQGTPAITFNAPPQPSTFRLAPDQYGNEIPPDAKWTKINRRFVSPEVLDQDHLRYEARPEFVAVLGVLSRAEIESLAERSRILRDERHRRSRPTQAPPPTQPPRPIPIPANMRQRSDRDTPSSSDQDSDSGHSVDRRRRNVKREKHRSYAGSNIDAPVSGYPNPYGQPLPSPVRSPPRDGRREYTERRDRDYDRERNDDHHRKHRSSTSSSRSRGDKDKSRSDRDRAYQKSSRWKENLTAAGIGGAAVSLLNVLSEAAEGL